MLKKLYLPVIVVAILLDIALTGAFLNARRPSDGDDEPSRGAGA